MHAYVCVYVWILLKMDRLTVDFGKIKTSAFRSTIDNTVWDWRINLTIVLSLFSLGSPRKRFQTETTNSKQFWLQNEFWWERWVMQVNECICLCVWWMCKKKICHTVKFAQSIVPCNSDFYFNAIVIWIFCLFVYKPIDESYHLPCVHVHTSFWFRFLQQNFLFFYFH